MHYLTLFYRFDSRFASSLTDLQTLQAGLEYSTCFSAYNTNPDPLGPNSSVIRCIIVRVVLPELSWIDTALQGDMLTPPNGNNYSVYPGCVLEIMVTANAVWYPVEFTYFTSEILLNGTERSLSNLPGAVLTPLAGSKSAESLAWGEAKATNYSQQAILQYQASRSMSGRQQLVCIQAADPFGMRSIKRCFHLRTGGCRACLRPEQTLAGLAAEYSTSWLQLWATNPRVGNPNHLLGGTAGAGAGAVLNLGVPYTAVEGDTAASLAARFFLTTAAVLAANPAFVISSGGAEAAEAAPLARGQVVCIVPPVCAVYCPGGGLCKRSNNPINAGFVS